jgi:hypothetical protein
VKSTSRPNCNKDFLRKKVQILDYWGKKETKFSCNKANYCVVCGEVWACNFRFAVIATTKQAWGKSVVATWENVCLHLSRVAPTHITCDPPPGWKCVIAAATLLCLQTWDSVWLQLEKKYVPATSSVLVCNCIWLLCVFAT